MRFLLCDELLLVDASNLLINTRAKRKFYGFSASQNVTFFLHHFFLHRSRVLQPLSSCSCPIQTNARSGLKHDLRTFAQMRATSRPSSHAYLVFCKCDFCFARLTRPIASKCSRAFKKKGRVSSTWVTPHTYRTKNIHFRSWRLSSFSNSAPQNLVPTVRASAVDFFHVHQAFVAVADRNVDYSLHNLTILTTSGFLNILGVI
jgi:hypothetical protein